MFSLCLLVRVKYIHTIIKQIFELHKYIVIDINFLISFKHNHKLFFN